jgi:hypothetical protein
VNEINTHHRMPRQYLSVSFTIREKKKYSGFLFQPVRSHSVRDSIRIHIKLTCMHGGEKKSFSMLFLQKRLLWYQLLSLPQISMQTGFIARIRLHNFIKVVEDLSCGVRVMSGLSRTKSIAKEFSVPLFGHEIAFWLNHSATVCAKMTLTINC